MENWQLALLLKPLAAVILFGCVALPGRFIVQKYMKDGKLKRLLLLRISN